MISQGIDENRAQLLSTFARGSIEKAIELSESAEFAIMRDEIQTCYRNNARQRYDRYFRNTRKYGKI